MRQGWNTPLVVHLSLCTPPVKNRHNIHGLRTSQVRISSSTGPFGLHDSFHESPRPRQHKFAHTLPLRRVCGKQKAVVYVSSQTPPVLYRHTCAKRRCARISCSTIDSSFGLHDSFHDSPSPCARAPASASPVRGTCGERAAVEYLRLKYTTGGASELIHTTGKKKLTRDPRTRRARICSSNGPFGLRDSFHESPTTPTQACSYVAPTTRMRQKKGGGVCKLKNTTGIVPTHMRKRRCARAYCITSSFGLHDSPSPCTRAPASTFPHGVRAANERRCIHG